MSGLRKRTVRLKKNSQLPEYIASKRLNSLCTKTADYKYFSGHIVPEIAKELPADKTVVCWHTEHMLVLPICAIRKFYQSQTYCKRCSLFQKDIYAQILKKLIKEWEKDEELEKEDE